MAPLTPLPYPSKLAGKRVLVFGGTSGIGFSVAALAVAEGAQVHISSSNPTKIAASIDTIKTGYPNAVVSGTACDLSDEGKLESNLRALLDEVTASGPLDHVVFTAGNALSLAHISEVSIDSIRSAGTVRFIAPAIFAKLVSKSPKYLNASAGSSITLTSGTNGAKPTQTMAIVAAYCGAIEALGRGLSVDMAPVRVNTVSPGAVDTEIWDGFSAEQQEGMKAYYAKATTTGEMGRPENIAEAYLYVIKDRAAAGKIIDSDGGRILV